MVAALNIVGAGKAGASLARLWQARGIFVIQDVLNRSPKSTREAISHIGAGRACTDLAELRPAEVTLLGVPDDDLAPLARALANAHASARSGPDFGVAFHLSGARSADILATLHTSGAKLASVHPLTSFADPSRFLTGLNGTPCVMEGDASACDLLGSAFAAIGGMPMAIDGANKLSYHASAVMASNYLVVLVAAALECYAQAGIDEVPGLAMLTPLLNQTLANVLALGPRAALSGPVARGDYALVRQEEALLAAHSPELGQLYRLMAARAARLIDRADPFAAQDGKLK